MILVHTLMIYGYALAQLVEALRYNPECRGFDSRWCHWSFSLAQSFRPHYGPGVDSTSNRNEYQVYFLRCKGGRCVGLTTLPPSFADFLEIWEPQPPGNPRDWCRPLMGLIYTSSVTKLVYLGLRFIKNCCIMISGIL